MAELEKKLETGSAPASAPALADANHEKALVPVSKPETTAAEVEKPPVPAKVPTSGGPLDRDIALAEVEKEKKFSYVKAWEESEKSRAVNRAEKRFSAVAAWENRKKATIEAELKKHEEQLERKRAIYEEKMKNKMALLHKEAEEKRAMIEARRGKEVLKVEETAAKHRAVGTIPKKTIGCF